MNMKPTIKITGGLVLLAWLTGCVVTSVYPFYTAKDVVFDPALLGRWAEAGSTNAANEHWQFDKLEGQAYKVTVVDKEKRTEYDAHLFKLKGRLFLDWCPRERPDDSIPPHYLLKVTRIESSLELTMLNYDWLKNLIEKDPKAIRHLVIAKPLGESGGGNVVLTANTAELQRFILKHETTGGVFTNGCVMKRL